MDLTLDHLESQFSIALRAGPLPASPKAAPPESPEDRANRYRFLAIDAETLASRCRAAGAICVARTIDAEAHRLRVAARACESRGAAVGPAEE